MTASRLSSLSPSTKSTRLLSFAAATHFSSFSESILCADLKLAQTTGNLVWTPLTLISFCPNPPANGTLGDVTFTAITTDTQTNRMSWFLLLFGCESRSMFSKYIQTCYPRLPQPFAVSNQLDRFYCCRSAKRMKVQYCQVGSSHAATKQDRHNLIHCRGDVLKAPDTTLDRYRFLKLSFFKCYTTYFCYVSNNG